MSPFRIRKTFKIGPIRLTASKRGVTPSARAGRVSASPRQTSARIIPGVSWVKRRKSG